MPLQSVGFRDAKLSVDAAQLALHLRVGGHRGEVGFLGVAARHRHAGAMNETFQQAELSCGRQSRKLAFNFAEDYCCHSGVILRFSDAMSTTCPAEAGAG